MSIILFISILHINNVRGGTMHLYGIDINPLKSNEFIVNGDDEYIRMYDKRKLSMGPIKQFQREITSTKSVKVNILYRYMQHIQIKLISI